MAGFGFPKRLLVVLCAALVLLAVFPHSLAAQSGGITLQVQPFFSGHYKFGEWLPLRVTVTNPGAAVSAQVRVEMTLAGGYTAWLVPVDLPTGAQKQFTLYVLPTSFAQVARVRVLNGTQQLAQANASLSLHPNNDYLVGVIAPRTEPFNVLGGMVLNGATARTVRVLPISLAEIPERPEGLRTLDALVLSDTDTSTLSPAQAQALTMWVQQGGRLLVGGGASAARTLAGLPDALVADFRGQNNLVEIQQLPAFEEFAGTPVRVQGPFVAAFSEKGEAVVAQQDRKLVVEKRAGDGYVTYSALDVSASPFDAWAGAGQFWKRILATGSAYPVNTPTDVSPNLIRLRYMAFALQNLPVLALPSVNVLTALLIAYIVLVGPVNYLALRRLKKLDWGWLTIPALTLLFAIGAFGVSNQLRGSDVILNQVSVLDFSADGTPRKMETVIGLYSPTRGAFDLEIPDAGLVIPVSNQYDPFSSGPDATGTNVEIVQSSPLVVRGIELNQGALQGFAVESPPPAAWRIEANLQVQGDRVVGTVTNRTDVPLKEVLVASGERYIRLNELPPNETQQVDEKWQFYGGYIGGLVTGNAPNSEARRQILGARFDNWRGSDRAAVTPMLIGWLDASPLDARVQNVEATRQMKTLVVAPVTLTFTPGTLRLGTNDWHIEEMGSSGERSYCGPINYTSVRNGELILQFSPPSSVHLTRVQSLKLMVQEGIPQTLQLQDTDGEWVTQEIRAPGAHEIKNPEKFVRANGAVRMRVSSKEFVDRCVMYSFEMEGEVGE